MYYIQYGFLCLFVGSYLYFHFSGALAPPSFDTARLVVAWGFLLWGGYFAGRIMVDCVMLYSKGEMTAPNLRNGFLLALLNYLPILLMSLFLLRGATEVAAGSSNSGQ